MRSVNITVEPYTDEELNKLEYAFITSDSYSDNEAGDFLRIRDLTILRLACVSGFRISEVLNLQWDKIDWNNYLVYISPYSNKQRNADPIVLNNKAVHILLDWQKVFNKHLVSSFVFPSLFTFEPITSSCYRRRLMDISKEAGIYKVLWHTDNGQPMSNKRFNSARKYFATKIQRSENNIFLTAKALRQKSIKSVMQYAFATHDEVREVEDKIFS